MADQTIERVAVLGAVLTQEQAEAQAKMFGRMAVRIVEIRAGNSLADGAEVLGFFVWPTATACPCCHRDGLAPELVKMVDVVAVAPI